MTIYNGVRIISVHCLLAERCNFIATYKDSIGAKRPKPLAPILSLVSLLIVGINVKTEFIYTTSAKFEVPRPITKSHPEEKVGVALG